MTPDGNTSPGIYFPADSDLDDRYDAFVGRRSRSAMMREALELHMVIDETLEEFDVEFDAIQEKKFFIRQALRNELQRDA